MAMIEPRGCIVPVLLSGGAGSRLWPLSRETYPKQLLSLLGDNTLLQQTALRIDGRPHPHRGRRTPRRTLCARHQGRQR